MSETEVRDPIMDPREGDDVLLVYCPKGTDLEGRVTRCGVDSVTCSACKIGRVGKRWVKLVGSEQSFERGTGRLQGHSGFDFRGAGRVFANEQAFLRWAEALIVYARFRLVVPWLIQPGVSADDVRAAAKLLGFSDETVQAWGRRD